MNHHVFLALLLLAGMVSQTAWAQESQVITNSIDMKLARIPAGTFVMGSPAKEPERDDKEDVCHEEHC